MFGSFQLWVAAWRGQSERVQSALGTRHVMLCVCEQSANPRTTGSTMHAGDAFRGNEPTTFAAGPKDADGRSPRHTYFIPTEECRPEALQRLSEFCQATGSEAELLVSTRIPSASWDLNALKSARDRLASHDLLSRDAEGRIRFAVGEAGRTAQKRASKTVAGPQNLSELAAAGCHALFAPHSAQALQKRLINSLYYTRGTDSHGAALPARRVYSDRNRTQGACEELLVVHPPLALDRERRTWGIIPDIDAAELHSLNPATARRMRLWLDSRVSVEGRPNWLFVTLHVRRTLPAELQPDHGLAMQQFYESLGTWMEADASLRFHYVTARELVNIVHAAEAGHSGDPYRFRDFRYVRAGAAQSVS